jgi:hypothetical protein
MLDQKFRAELWSHIFCKGGFGWAVKEWCVGVQKVVHSKPSNGSGLTVRSGLLMTEEIFSPQALRKLYNDNNSRFDTRCSPVMRIQSAVKCHCYLTQKQHTTVNSTAACRRKWYNAASFSFQCLRRHTNTHSVNLPIAKCTESAVLFMVSDHRRRSCKSFTPSILRIKSRTSSKFKFLGVPEKNKQKTLK